MTTNEIVNYDYIRCVSKEDRLNKIEILHSMGMIPTDSVTYRDKNSVKAMRKYPYLTYDSRKVKFIGGTVHHIALKMGKEIYMNKFVTYKQGTMIKHKFI